MSIYEPQDSLFQENIVFGTVPLGNPADTSFNLFHHINNADIIIVETITQFSRLISGLRDYLNRIPIGIQVEPRATVYVYNLRHDRDHIKKMNEFFIDEALNKNKKILIVSDEGCSNFLDPGSFLKFFCIERNIPYKTLPGPNAIIATITSAYGPADNFAFSVDSDLIAENEKEKYYGNLKNLGCSIVFTTNPETILESLRDFQKYFGPEYQGEVFINLTRKDESAIRGNFQNLIERIEKNPELVNYFCENENRRYTIMITPLNMYNPQKDLPPEAY